jgi:membrane protein
MLGLALLLYSGIKLISAVERSLNEVWGIQRGRPWARRVSDYVAIVVITPILLLVGTTGMAAVRAVRLHPSWGSVKLDVGRLRGFLLQGVPLMTFFVGLTFAYLALPNTRVRLRSAMIGGAAASVLWLFSQYVYIELQVGIAKFNVLYAGFAAFPILLVWIFLSWAIFLTGAELCYAHQSVPLFTSIARMGTVDQTFRESLALRLSGRIADAFLAGRPPRESAELATELGISPRAVNGVLERLVEHEILARTADDDDRYLPARDPEAVTVLDVLTAMRTEAGAVPPAARGRVDERVDRILAGLQRETRESLFNHTLRELALSSRASEAESAPSTAARGEAAEGLRH